MINPAELIKLADEIDNRLGPIPGRTADRIAVLLRSIATERDLHGISGDEDIAAELLRTTEMMASMCSVNMELWNRHSNACLKAAGALKSKEE